MQVSGETYRVWRDKDSARINFEGALRLSGTASYAPIAKLLEEVGTSVEDQVTLDISKLQYLNSAGINMFYKFAVSLRNRGDLGLLVYGSSEYPWQKKMLNHMNRFIKRLEIKYV